MSANIYMHEIRSRLKSVLVWSLGLVFLIIFFFSLFPAFSKDTAMLNEFLSRYPQSMRSAFGLNNMDLSNSLGFFSFIFVFAQLLLAIQAANYGFGLVSIEESELTADFLLSKPVSRTKVLNSKLLAAFTSLTITNLVVWVSSFIALEAYKGDHPYELSVLLLLLGSIVIFQLFFLGVGLVISLLVKRVRSVTPYGLGLGMGAYVLNAFSGIFSDVKLEYLTPFKHFDPAYIIQNKSLNTQLVLLNAAVIVISLAVSYWLYTRRDIPAVS